MTGPPVQLGGRPQPLPMAGAAGAPETTARLPLAWFGAGLLWLAVGSGLLVLTADTLAGGLVYSPAVFAVVHVFSLGAMGSVIFGALHQFIPATTGVAIRHWPVARLGFWLWQPGLAVLLAGFWVWSPGWQAGGWILLFLAVGCASWNILPARRRAARNRHVGLFASLAHSALGLAMLLAAARIGDGLGWWTTSRDGLIAAHLHLGVFGFGGLTLAGVGSRMLPAFFQAPPRDGPLRFLAWSASLGLVALSVGATWRLPWLTVPGGVVLLAALLVQFRITSGFIRGATVPKFDVALGFLTGSTVWLGLSIGIGAALLISQPGPGPVWIAYLAAGLLGWLIPAIAGVLHRVGPRVLTLVLAGEGRPIPQAARRVELIRPRLGWTALACWTAGLPGFVIGVASGSGIGARVGAILLVAGALLLLAQAISVLARATGREPEPAQPIRR